MAMRLEEIVGLTYILQQYYIILCDSCVSYFHCYNECVVINETNVIILPTFISKKTNLIDSTSQIRYNTATHYWRDYPAIPYQDN